MRFDISPSVSRDPWVRALIILATIFAALKLGEMVWGLIAQVGDLLILFVVAWIISFVLEPTVAGLERIAWMSRTLAVALVYLLVLLALAGALMILVPTVAEQSAAAAQQLPRLIDHVAGLGSGLADFFISRGIPVESYVDMLRPMESTLVGHGLTVATGAASVATQMLLIIVLSIYLMLDGAHLARLFLEAFPARYRDDFVYFSSILHRSFGGFLRGQIIQALVYGLGISIIMAATDLPFIALASVLATFAMFIPFFGPFLGTLPPMLVVLTTDITRWWIVLLPTMVLNIVVVNVIAPKVMSQQIGLHPIVVLAAVLVGARLAGPWGAVFGAPAAAVLSTMASFYQLTRAERKARVLEVTGPPEPGDEPPDVILEPPPERVPAER